MSVKDMIKKSVLESGAFTNYDVPGILTALAAAPVSYTHLTLPTMEAV